MSKLFERLKIRDFEFRNRIWISPMCQYSAEDGFPNDWHLVHLGSRAVGGAGLVVAEATSVSPDGRISPGDLGIWSDEHVPAFRRITEFIKQHGAAAGIQIAHAGRKASTATPWDGGGMIAESDGGWKVSAPSAVRFADNFPEPRDMSLDDIENTAADFTKAALRAVDAGFDVIEIHAAHGYLLHEFLSPLANHRTDEYGGRLENRMRFPLEVARRIRDVVPAGMPVFVRISASDWIENGWDVAQSVEFSSKLKEIGIDLIDVSSGGMVPDAKIEISPGYQVPFAAEIRTKAGIATSAVGMITEPIQAESILQNGEADAVLIARESLRDPYFPIRAAQELGGSVDIPKQYGRGISLQRATNV